MDIPRRVLRLVRHLQDEAFEALVGKGIRGHRDRIARAHPPDLTLGNIDLEMEGLEINQDRQGLPRWNDLTDFRQPVEDHAIARSGHVPLASTRRDRVDGRPPLLEPRLRLGHPRSGDLELSGNLFESAFRLVHLTSGRSARVLQRLHPLEIGSGRRDVMLEHPDARLRLHDSCLGRRDTRPGLAQPGFELRVVELGNHLAGSDPLALGDVQAGDPARDLGRELDLVSLDPAVGVERILAVVFVPAGGRHQHGKKSEET